MSWRELQQFPVAQIQMSGENYKSFQQRRSRCQERITTVSSSVDLDLVGLCSTRTHSCLKRKKRLSNPQHHSIVIIVNPVGDLVVKFPLKCVKSDKVTKMCTYVRLSADRIHHDILFFCQCVGLGCPCKMATKLDINCDIFYLEKAYFYSPGQY